LGRNHDELTACESKCEAGGYITRIVGGNGGKAKMKDVETGNCNMPTQYDSLFELCKKSANWILMEHVKKKIKNIDCEIVHFFNEISGGSRNMTFFICNSVIIGVGNEYMQEISLFGEDY